MKLTEQILEIAKKYPERIAVEEREQSFTYRDLMAASAQIAKKINAEKLSNRPILVFGKNDFLTLAAMIASNLTGHAYVPVDAHTPFERAQMILEGCQQSIVISTVALEAEFNQLFANKISFIKFDKSTEFPEIDTSNAVSGEQADYIIFTSGTTGKPKGVEVNHDNLVTFTNWMNQDFCQIEENHILSQALYSFDLSIFSLYPALTTGGTLVSLSREETTNFKLLFERLNASEINTWISTPSFVDICLLDPSFVQEKHPKLTQFIFCGEELTVKTAQKLLKNFPDATIWNTYGPTEATGAISVVKVTEELVKNYSRVPLGVAKPGVELKILENEIIIVGDSVANGYFENPQKTEEVFFEFDGKRAYRTGDAGFIDENGIVNYNGRIDFQVKFNGFRIELQDIEAHLLALDDIDKAVVLASENEQHKVTGLVAICKTSVKFDDKKAEREFNKTIKAELSKSIMDYMQPTKFIYIDEFPLNQNGKIDRKALEVLIG